MLSPYVLSLLNRTMLPDTADEAWDGAAATVYDHVVDDGRRARSRPLNVSVIERRPA